MSNKPVTKKRRILVADDDALQRMLTREALEQSDFEVIDAADGELALRLFEEQRPDLILLDVKMPKIDGFTVCARIRHDSAGVEVPIVMITGLDDFESIEQAYRCGATDFLTKPVLWSVLSHRVRYLLRASNAISELRRSESRLRQAQRVARLGNWDWDLQSDMVVWSDEVHRLLSIDADQLGASLPSFMEHVHADDRLRVRAAIDEALQSRQPLRVEHRMLGAGENEVHVEQQAKLMVDHDGVPLRMIGTIQDVSERKRAEMQIHLLAYYDSLTGLPNRALFRKVAERALKDAERKGEILGLIFVDLDGFKYVNDSLGHEAGDQLLCEIAAKMQHSVRPGDAVCKLSGDVKEEAAVARLGGDEFTILLPGLKEAKFAASVAERVLQNLQEPYRIQGKDFFPTGSIGIAVYPNDGDSVEKLLKNADIAMYHAKNDGKNGYRFYDKQMEAKVQARLNMEGRLKKALEKNEFDLHYQAKIDLVTGVIVGVEALLRWNNDEVGRISPDRFVPIAEETGLIDPIGEWVLDAACRQGQQWCKSGLEPVRIAVNFSGRQLRRGALVEKVNRAVSSTGWDPQYLELELTESVLMGNADETVQVLQVLRDMGLGLSIDDFGTGYSSMSYVKRFSPDALKIDRSFVKDIATDPNDEAIVKAIIAMSKGLNLKCVAEGVESEAQLDFLRRHGCDQAQGFLINVGIPGSEMQEMLRASQSGQALPGLPWDADAASEGFPAPGKPSAAV